VGETREDDVLAALGRGIEGKLKALRARLDAGTHEGEAQWGTIVGAFGRLLRVYERKTNKKKI